MKTVKKRVLGFKFYLIKVILDLYMLQNYACLKTNDLLKLQNNHFYDLDSMDDVNHICDVKFSAPVKARFEVSGKNFEFFKFRMMR